MKEHIEKILKNGLQRFPGRMIIANGSAEKIDTMNAGKPKSFVVKSRKICISFILIFVKK